ncbi:MAG: hypothetical protein AMXMBFR64_22440 [Myxococcales bacterium]
MRGRTFTLVAAIWAAQASADPFHRSGVLVGERAAGMGGAFTALGDDGSAGHYNPAALATLPGSSFSLSASLYGYHAERVDGSRAVEHFGLLDFQTIPGATATVMELSEGQADGTLRVVGGFGLFVTEHESASSTLLLRDVQGRSEGKAVLFDRFLQTSQVDQETLEGALSVAIRVAPWLDLGISALVLYRALLRDESWDGAIEDANSTRFFRLQLAMDGAWVGLAGAVGVHSNPWEGLHLGVQVRTPPVRLYGSATISGALWSQSGEPSTERFPEESARVEHKLSPELCLGVAWASPRVFAVALDVALRFPMDPYLDVDDPDFGRLVERNLAWDVAVGVEGYPVDWIALRGGFFTSNTSGGAGDPTLDPVPAVDELGVSGGLGFHIGPTTLSVGADYRWGEGTMSPLGPYSAEQVTRRTETLRVHLATTYYY